ncbi:MAG: cupin domain-containing protein [Planctomycetota bacterium]
MNPSIPIDPRSGAVYSATKMSKATIFESPRVLVGTNAFEPGQRHAPHAHAGADKIYYILEGEGEFSLADATFRVRAGEMLVAPAGIVHGVTNDTNQRLLVMIVMAPAP